MNFGQAMDRTKKSGLDRSKIRQIQEFEYIGNSEAHQDENCVICYENFNVGEKFKLLQCGHKFHSECIDDWLSTKNSCPLCNLKVDI
jgi:hypothetical protein